ncbi:MAG TPA: chemotaxis protein CheW [Planctomycetota bacterium]|nr:chemotaxis protein CheW [Planctomycetota bacterium]
MDHPPRTTNFHRRERSRVPTNLDRIDNGSWQRRRLSPRRAHGHRLAWSSTCKMTRPDNDAMDSCLVSRSKPRIDLLVFELERQRCALLAQDVVEVQRAVAAARLPAGPAIVEGVIDLRGKVVPVLDVRLRLGLPARALSPADHLIVTRVAASGGPRVVALRVDQGLELASVPAAAIEDARAAVPGARHVAGVAKLPDGLVLIHDLRGFLSLDEERSIDAAIAAVSREGGGA